MPSPSELLDNPYVFTQLSLLTPDEFLKQLELRGLKVSTNFLQAVHRTGLLRPFVRVKRDGRAMAAVARRKDDWSPLTGQDHLTTRRELLEARDRGGIHDPATEPFQSRTRMARTAYGVTYLSSQYLYSHHQLLSVPALKRIVPFLQFGAPDGRNAKVKVGPGYQIMTRADAHFRASLIAPLSVLETLHYPYIVGTFSGNVRGIERWQQWRETVGPVKVMQGLGITAQWLRDAGSRLLLMADQADPLGRWSEVVRDARPATWWYLKGDARSALDMRLAAEVLLSHYDTLVKARRAPQLPKRTGMERGEFDTRFRPQGKIDKTLTAFGLSPHPSLILVVEGDTEERILPRLMRHRGVSTNREFITIVNREGVDKEISSLLAYAIAPVVEADLQPRHLLATRPLAHVLVLSDPENSMTTEEKRGRRRETWVSRILKVLDEEYRTDAVRQALETLIHVDVWKGKQSFEYAHFSNRELAVAISAVDTRFGKRKLADRIVTIKKQRADSVNVLHALGKRGSKVSLADELWPVLLRKVKTAEATGSESKIPVVRVLDLAVQLAMSTHRGQVIIPLETEQE
jgi:hypothetical protein